MGTNHSWVSAIRSKDPKAANQRCSKCGLEQRPEQVGSTINYYRRPGEPWQRSSLVPPCPGAIPLVDDSEARRVAKFINEQWPFIPEQDAHDFYWGLGHINTSEGTVKVSLWVLKWVLDHEKPVECKLP